MKRIAHKLRGVLTGFYLPVAMLLAIHARTSVAQESGEELIRARLTALLRSEDSDVLVSRQFHSAFGRRVVFFSASARSQLHAERRHAAIVVIDRDTFEVAQLSDLDRLWQRLVLLFSPPQAQLPAHVAEVLRATAFAELDAAVLYCLSQVTEAQRAFTGLDTSEVRAPAILMVAGRSRLVFFLTSREGIAEVMAPLPGGTGTLSYLLRWPSRLN